MSVFIATLLGPLLDFTVEYHDALHCQYLVEVILAIVTVPIVLAIFII